MHPSLSLRDTLELADRRSFLLLRWLLILAVASLYLASRLYQPATGAATLVMLTFAASNVARHVFWSRLESVPGFESLLAAIDTLFLSLSISLSGVAPIELFVLSFLVIFLVSFGRTLPQIVASSVAVGFLYIWMTAQLRPEGMLLHPAFLIRLPFLYSVALYFGSFAARVNADRRAALEILSERRERQTLLDIQEAINSSLDLRQVMHTITTKVAAVVHADRCSILLIESDDRSTVLASSDGPDIDRLELDLAKYPEVRRAIEMREPVVIPDVQSHPLMREVRHHISGAGFNSILVVPMIHRDDLIGTLMLRAASTESEFNPRVIAFCEAIAGASANALKNALLYRRVKEESALHRATALKLQNVLEHSMDLILTADLEGRITDFNRSAERALGYGREEILGAPLTAIYTAGGDRSQLLALLRKEGAVEWHDAVMRARDGSLRPFDITISVVRNELDEVIGSVCLGKRIHART